MDGGRFKRSIVPVNDMNGVLILDQDEHRRPGSTVETLGDLKPAFQDAGQRFGLDAVALQKYHHVERISHVHTGANSSGIVDGAALVLVGSERPAGTSACSRAPGSSPPPSPVPNPRSCSPGPSRQQRKSSPPPA
jgi:acetyl-CoA C-acetyltransferase